MELIHRVGGRAVRGDGPNRPLQNSGFYHPACLCHPERRAGPLPFEKTRFFAPLRMTVRAAAPFFNSLRIRALGGSLLGDQDLEGVASVRLQPEPPRGQHGGVRQAIRQIVRRGDGAPGVEGLTWRFKNDAGKSHGKSPGRVAEPRRRARCF